MILHMLGYKNEKHKNSMYASYNKDIIMNIKIIMQIPRSEEYHLNPLDA